MTENELTSILLQLADLGITGIKVKYSGGGDEGYIEWIGYTKKPCKDPEDVNDNMEDWEDDCKLSNLGSDVYDKIENFVYSKLLDNIEDWYNNEGGWGDLCICVPSGKYIINNNIRVSIIEEYFHNDNLLNISNDYE